MFEVILNFVMVIIVLNKKEQIKDYARKIGFDKIGFASAEPFWEEKEILMERKRAGLFSPFEESDIELRCHPEKHLPGAKTIICFAVSYFFGKEDMPGENSSEPLGIISKYALMRDYHGVLFQKLKLMADFIYSMWGAKSKIFVDSAGLLERAAARRAGIGWIGQNTCLFTEEFGSWVFLGEMITDLEIEPDMPCRNQCDNCGKCVKACPTRALEGPYRLNPFRCLSYITQMRGTIPEEFRDIMGLRLFGCDTCQEACPKNKKIILVKHEEFMLDYQIERRLIKLIFMDNVEFDKNFKLTPIAWRGRNVLRRNATVALANTGVGCKKYFEKLLSDPSPVIREHAMWALKR
ncbi:tRNA epoxyqueuosine(34) reductase QueG [Thermovorax subterraneus]|nr:tRNA epoxyqueuosine(34) reductase QueG [Thermovorax subterraneus]